MIQTRQELQWSKLALAKISTKGCRASSFSQLNPLPLEVRLLENLGKWLKK